MKSLIESTLKDNKKLEQENAKLKGKAIKNSTNSSVPPSKDENRKQINHREKTGRKPGGQKGRIGKTLTVEDIEKKISKGEVQVEVEEYGNISSSKDTRKYIVDIETIVKVRKIIIHSDVKYKDIPKYLQTKSAVIYGDNIKILVGIMAELEVIAYDRMQEFIEILTNDVLSVSHGSLVNWVNKLSEKSKKFCKKITRKLKRQLLLYTDGTESKVDGRKAYIRNYSSEHMTVYKPASRKSIEAIRSHEVLNDYFGYIMHDHETALFNFSLKERHLDCWIHLGRDLKYVFDLTGNSWANEMWELGWNMKLKRDEYVKRNITEFTEKELNEFNKKYDEIIAKGYEQNKKVKEELYRKKELPIINRLKKYKNAYTLFTKNFSFPFDNNLSERDLRPAKTKKKVIGCHRSFNGLKGYCNIATIISTCRKQSISFVKVFKKILNDEPIVILSSGYIQI